MSKVGAAGLPIWQGGGGKSTPPPSVTTAAPHSSSPCGQARVARQVAQIHRVLVAKDPRALELIPYMTQSGIILPTT